MTYKELDQHLLETMDEEVADMRQVSWPDLEKLHKIAAMLDFLWHPKMQERMEQTVIASVEKHIDVEEAQIQEPESILKRHSFYNS